MTNDYPSDDTLTECALLVSARLPAGVSALDFASHLADAHRAAIRQYSLSDPITAISEIGVAAALC
jgi:hypothetical protein